MLGPAPALAPLHLILCKNMHNCSNCSLIYLKKYMLVSILKPIHCVLHNIKKANCTQILITYYTNINFLYCLNL